MDKFVTPEIWNDDDAIYRLYVPIKRPRHIDPTSYDFKISFWTDLILSYAKHNRIAVVNESSLVKLFKREFRSDGTLAYPQCLHQVLTDMMKKGLLDVVNHVGLVSNIANWGFDWMIKKPISWAWTFLIGGESVNSPLNQRSYESPDTLLYLTEQVLPLCELFIENLKETQESLVHEAHVYIHDDFEKTLSQFFEHVPTRMFILRQLRDKAFIRIESSTPVALVFLLEDKQTVNFDCRTLSSIAHLRKTMRQINLELERLSNEISNRRKRARILVQNNRKAGALDLLRRCKQMEVELSRKTQHLVQLEALELKIDAAKDNQTVLHAISEARSALLRNTGGLAGLEDAEKTVDDMAEAINDTNAISNAIFIQPDDSRTIEDAELTEELEELLAEGSTRRIKIGKSPQPTLPTPPAEEVGGESEDLSRALTTLAIDSYPTGQGCSTPNPNIAL